MMSATWPEAVRNVQMVLLFYMTKHQEHKSKIARPVQKVTIDHGAFFDDPQESTTCALINLYFRSITLTISLNRIVVSTSNLYRFKAGFLFAVTVV